MIDHVLLKKFVGPWPCQLCGTGIVFRAIFIRESVTNLRVGVKRDVRFDSISHTASISTFCTIIMERRDFMPDENAPRRYHPVHVILHWLVAPFPFFLLYLGLFQFPSLPNAGSREPGGNV